MVLIFPVFRKRSRSGGVRTHTHTPATDIFMATNKLVAEAQKLESCGAAGDGDSSVPVKTVLVPAKCGPGGAAQPPLTAAAVSKTDSVPGPPKVIPTAKLATSGVVSANGQLQVTKPPLSQVTSMNQATTPGRTVVITVPRVAAPQPVAVAPRLPQTASSQLPANIHIPP
ncbi:transcription initiation factor TFIID subunit 4-like protein, partial [Lates japonicus]